MDKTWIVLRKCGPNGITIVPDDLDSGRLSQWSVYLGANLKEAKAYAIKAGGEWTHCATTSVEKVKQNGGGLVEDHDPKNAGHYLLNTMLVADAKQIFSTVSQLN